MRRQTLLLAWPALLAVAACGQAPVDKEKAGVPQAARQAAVAAAELSPAMEAKLDRTHAGTPAPTVLFEIGPDGKTGTIADLKGKRVLVNLWATWCAPCLKEMPALDRLAKRAGDWLTVLPLSQDLEGWRVVGGFFAPGKFPALSPRLDSQMAFGAAIGARGLPITILYDERGREIWRLNGDFAWDGAEAGRLLGV